MNESLLISEILKENFPVECEEVGPANLEDIAEGEAEFTPAEHGSYMDLGDAIATLVAATTIIKNVIEIYKAVKDKLGRHPKKDETDEIEERVFSKKENSQRLDKETRDRLMKTTIRKLKDQSKR